MIVGPPQAIVEHFQFVFSDVLNQRNADLLLDDWHPDVVEEFPVGVFRGRDQVHAHFVSTFAAIPDFHIEARDVTAGENKAFIRWHMTGTFNGAPWVGFQPTGDRLEIDGIDCFTLRDGLVIHGLILFDQLAFARQIGLLPKPGTLLDRVATGAFNARVRLRNRFRSLGHRWFGARTPSLPPGRGADPREASTPALPPPGSAPG
jgi:predicted ester cyclase